MNTVIFDRVDAHGHLTGEVAINPDRVLSVLPFDGGTVITLDSGHGMQIAQSFHDVLDMLAGSLEPRSMLGYAWVVVYIEYGQELTVDQVFGNQDAAIAYCKKMSTDPAELEYIIYSCYKVPFTP